MTKTHGSTSNEGKIKATEWARVRSVCSPGRAVYVVGNPDGFLRHIQDKERLGYTKRHHLVVEIDKTQWERLQRMNIVCGLPLRPNQIVHGDIFDMIDSGVSHLDCDFAHTLDEETHESLRRALTKGIENIHIVFCTRTRNLYWETAAPPRCQVPEVRQCGAVYKQKPTPAQKYVLPEIIRDMAGGYEIQTLPYRGNGKTPMLMMVLNKC